MTEAETSLPEGVRRKLQELFFDVHALRDAGAALRAYVADCPSAESERIALAIVKLSEGELQRLRSTIQAACTDYRDVLAWAEYPEELRLGPNADPEQLRAARSRDRAQYLRWLGGVDRS